MLILSIESSCDETSAAVIQDSTVLSNVISSQLFHGKYGGVVPELASRAHLSFISQITSQALEEAKTKFGWQSTIDIFQTLELTFDWYKIFYEKKDVVALTNKQIESIRVSSRESC